MQECTRTWDARSRDTRGCTRSGDMPEHKRLHLHEEMVVHQGRREGGLSATRAPDFTLQGHSAGC